MAGIKLASCGVKNLYGKSSIRKSEKDDRGTEKCYYAKSNSQKISAKEKVVAPGYGNQ
jgi:hypothetical protein